MVNIQLGLEVVWKTKC